jgi:crotonobetainyl-CoA:carnitine CoA-transferase CaiB-like acyl-CoA transferase
VQERGIVVDAPDEEIGETPMHAPVPRLSRTPAGLRMPAPSIGQHNDEIYGRIGYAADRRARLEERGVI